MNRRAFVSRLLAACGAGVVAAVVAPKPEPAADYSYLAWKRIPITPWRKDDHFWISANGYRVYGSAEAPPEVVAKVLVRMRNHT